MCYDKRSLKLLGKSKEEQLKSLESYQEQRLEKFKNAILKKVDMTRSDISDYDAKLSIGFTSENKIKNITLFFCKKINGQWKITAPKIPKKDQNKEKFKMKEIKQPEKIKETPQSI